MIAYWVGAVGLALRLMERSCEWFGKSPWKSFFIGLGELMNAVTVIVMTEFGRRFAENFSFGTDHGRVGTMLLMGGSERGNVLGAIPVIEIGILVGPGDVPVITDYRDVLRPILTRYGAGRAMGKIFVEN